MYTKPIFTQVTYGYRMVCYYENWSQYREGVQKMMPSDIDPSLCTHVLYAFAKITDGVLAPIEWNDFSKLITLYIHTVTLFHHQAHIRLYTSYKKCMYEPYGTVELCLWHALAGIHDQCCLLNTCFFAVRVVPS